MWWHEKVGPLGGNWATRVGSSRPALATSELTRSVLTRKPDRNSAVGGPQEGPPQHPPAGPLCLHPQLRHWETPVSPTCKSPSGWNDVSAARAGQDSEGITEGRARRWPGRTRLLSQTFTLHCNGPVSQSWPRINDKGWKLRLRGCEAPKGPSAKKKPAGKGRSEVIAGPGEEACPTHTTKRNKCLWEGRTLS